MKSTRVNCKDCNKEFNINFFEIKFLSKLSPKINEKIENLPLPKQCPGCREKNRIAFRNEFNFFKRKCSLTKKTIVSIYPEDTEFPVYDQKVWWSDDFDPYEYGKDFDFSKTFFEQYNELNKRVPKFAIGNAKSENSEYTNYSAENRNCYICAGSSFNENCYYCSRVTNSKYVCDSYSLDKCEYCYFCASSSTLYGSAYSINCQSSSNLFLCDNCVGCKDCFGCTDLNGSQYCIFNQQLSKEDYINKRKELLEQFNRNELNISELRSKREKYIVACEDCSGNQLMNSKNCKSCFGLKESEDCLNVGCGTMDKDCLDSSFMDKCELMYYSTNLIGDYRVLFAAHVWYTNDSMYVMNSFNSDNIFACSGIKRGQYSILNKRYSKSDYHKLASKIIAHMKETGEWGSYFPLKLSPFAYNSTVANDYYPMSKEEILNAGLKYQEIENTKSNSDLKKCVVSGKNFKVSEHELEICNFFEINPPNKCYDVRRNELLANFKQALSNYTLPNYA